MSGGSSPELVALLASQAGLDRALKLFPESVQAAAERGLKPLGAHPGGYDPLTPPAAVFDPASFENDR